LAINLYELTLPCLFFLGSAISAWKWAVAGGIILIMEGIIICLLMAFFVSVHHSHMIFRAWDAAIIVFPPVISGIFFILSGRKPRR
jgi:hypothetical protein